MHVRVSVAALFLVVLGTMAGAQTPVTIGPVTTAMKFAFECSANVVPQTSTECLTYEWRLRLDTIPATALQNLTCAGPVAPATSVTCTAPLSQANVDTLNRAGSHSVTLAGYRADVGEGGASVPFVLKSRPTAPTGLRVIP